MSTASLYKEENGLENKLEQTEIYVTSDSVFWAAMRSKEIYPFSVSLTEQSVQVAYDMKAVSKFIPGVSSGSVEMDELAAHGSVVLWKAVIALMKMLARYDTEEKLAKTVKGNAEETFAYTTDQYLVWVLSFRGITPSRVSSRGKDTSFEFGRDKIEQLKNFLFFPYRGNVNNYLSMRNVWRQARTFRQIYQ